MHKKGAPLYKLKTAILQKFGRQYLAAARLKLRDDQLSSLLSGRRELTEGLVLRLEKMLRCQRSEFLPTGHVLENPDTARGEDHEANN